MKVKAKVRMIEIVPPIYVPVKHGRPSPHWAHSKKSVVRKRVLTAFNNNRSRKQKATWLELQSLGWRIAEFREVER